MTLSSRSDRAALNRSASDKGECGAVAGSRIRARTCSANGDPPGSRVTTGSMPRAASLSASSRTCVDLPEPSPPSKVMNLPVAMASPDPPIPRPPLLAMGTLRQPTRSQAEDRVKPPPHRAARLHVLGRVERHLAHGVVGGGDAQHRDLVAFPHGGLQRPLVDDVRLELLAGGAARQPDVDAAVADERHVHALAAPHARMPHHLAG